MTTTTTKETIEHGGMSFQVERRPMTTKGLWTVAVWGPQGYYNRRKDLDEHRLDAVQQQLLDEWAPGPRFLSPEQAARHAARHLLTIAERCESLTDREREAIGVVRHACHEIGDGERG